MPPVGLQNWRDILFLHWPVSASALRRHVPACLSIDEYDSTAYVSLVPFRVEAARLIGGPAAFGLEFLETNVRTYVHRRGREHGVYFFSLDAASLLAVLGARAGLGLPYFWAAGRYRRVEGEVDYRLRRLHAGQPECYVRYQVGELTGPAAPGTLEHFLVERYILHVQRGPTLWSVRVHHRPYPLQQARVTALQDELVAAGGINVDGPPAVVHFASGVDVEIFPPCITPAW